MTHSLTAHGFSLIEVLVYLALFALIMTGSISGYTALTETTRANSAESRLTREGMFLEDRIVLRVRDATSVRSPTSEAPTTALIVATTTPVSLSATQSVFTEIQSSSLPLTDSSISASNVAFSLHPQSVGKVLLYAFTLSLHDDAGRVHSMPFSGSLFLSL